MIKSIQHFCRKGVEKVMVDSVEDARGESYRAIYKQKIYAARMSFGPLG